MAIVDAKLLSGKAGDLKTSFKLPNVQTVTNWNLRINFSDANGTLHYVEVTAVGGYDDTDARGLHRTIYCGVGVQFNKDPIIEHEVGILGFVLGDSTSEENVLIIPITHVIGAEAMVYVNAKSANTILGIELVQVTI